MMSSEITVGRATSMTARPMRDSMLSVPCPWPAPRLPSGSCRRRTMFSTITTPPSTIMPKSTEPMESRFADMPRMRR